MSNLTLYRIAGKFEAPPATLEEINQWAMSKLYAQEVYVCNDALKFYKDSFENTVKNYKRMMRESGITDENKIKEEYDKRVEYLTKEVNDAKRKLKETIKEAKKYPLLKPAKFKVATKTFKVDYTGWKYKRIIEKAKPEALEEAERRFGKIKMILKSDFLRGDAKGYWRERNSSITIGGVVFGLKEALEHELEHWSQSFLSVIIDKYDSFGYPSKRIQNPNITQHTRDRDLLKTLKTKDTHSMDDVEFYPEISDAVYSVRKYIKSVGRKYKKDIVKWYVGAKVEIPDEVKDEIENIIPSKFYRTLKLESRFKWRKAVKELIKQM